MNGYIKKQSLMDYCDNTADKTIDNNDIARFPVSPVIDIDRALEIIDSEAWSYCDYIIKNENGNGDKQGAASHLADNIREAVLALKDGDRDCDNCKHHVTKDGQTGCEAWECEFAERGKES